MIKVKVRLNGTASNPYEKLGLTQNPFPRIPKAEYASANRLLADLEARPIADVEALRDRLLGCDQAFVELCVAQFKPGEMAQFEVEFPEPRDG